MDSDHNNPMSATSGFDSYSVTSETPLLEIEPENELIFVESAVDSPNAHIHSSSAVDFHGGLSHALLTLKNVSSNALLFKIQTTSPIHYRVKPSHGRIEIGEVKEIQISLLSESKKIDKFLINVVPTFEPLESSLDFTTQFNSCPENFIQKYRLRCVIPGSGGSGLLAATTGVTGAGGSTGSVGHISSPVAPNLQSTLAAGAGDSMNSIGSIEKSPSVPIQKSSPSISSASTSISILQRELKEARSEIERLKAKSNIPKEWKDLLSAQYGAPPVLVLLVAIFAFMIGLLF